MGFKKVKLIGGHHRCPVLVGLNIIVFFGHCVDLFIFALHTVGCLLMLMEVVCLFCPW